MVQDLCGSSISEAPVRSTFYGLIPIHLVTLGRFLRITRIKPNGVRAKAVFASFDGNLGTCFQSSYNDWQYVQADFGTVGSYARLRRYMTTGEDSPDERGFGTPLQNVLVPGLCLRP